MPVSVRVILTRPSPARRDFHQHLTGRPVELDGVIEQIDQRLLNLQAVSEHLRVLHAPADQGDAAQPRFRLQGAQGRLHGPTHRDGLRFGPRLARFQLRKRQQIRGDVVQADGVRLDDFEEAAIVFLVFQRPFQQRFGVTADGGERRAQLMRNVGDKIPADALQALEVGDVVQDGNGAARASPK